MAQLPDDQRVSTQVARIVADGAGSSWPSLALVAKRLGLSPRTLRRRLAADGSSFSAVAADTRQELARRYVASPDVAITEVAFLLGYSEVSAFHRAFRRWTGSTPAAFRAQALCER